MMDTVPPPAAKAKDFLSILDLDHRSLEQLLELARQMKADRRLGPKADRRRAGRPSRGAPLREAVAAHALDV